MVNSDYIHVSVDGHLMTIVLNHPERANAINEVMIKAMLEAFRQAGQNPDVRAVLLRGMGGVFSAGQDVKEMENAQMFSYRKHLQNTYNPLILTIRRLKKPVMALLDGAVAGAALGIALACDLRIASEDTVITVGFLQLGLIPDSAVTLLLPVHIGLGRAMELSLLNGRIDASTALAWGLVNKVVSSDRIEYEADEWAKKLIGAPIGAIGLTKRAFNRAVLPYLEKVLDYEAHLQEIARTSPEHQEGVQAFLEKRAPKFINTSDLN